MSRNGVGTYVLPAGNPVVGGTTISASVQNNTMTDIATALTGSIAANGETPITANIPMGTYKFTGVGTGTARTDSANVGNVQDGLINWVAGGGTADAITASYSPAITALVDGQACYVRATAANATTTPTFAPNGLTAHTITLRGGQALVAGNIYGVGHELELRYNLASTRWELNNPNLTGTAFNASSATTSLHVTSDAIVTGVVTSSGATSGIGYATGAGGAVTQLTSISTAVTLNTMSGTITMFSNSWATNNVISFSFNNSNIALTDTVILTCNGGNNNFILTAKNTSAGAIAIIGYCVNGGFTEAVKINFAIIKSVAA